MALLVLTEPAPPVALPMPPLTFLACADVTFLAPRSFIFFVAFPFFATIAFFLSGLIEPFVTRRLAFDEVAVCYWVREEQVPFHRLRSGLKRSAPLDSRLSCLVSMRCCIVSSGSFRGGAVADGVVTSWR